MTQEGKDKIITRAIHFIATNTKDESYRIGQAIIAELDLVKKLTIPDVIVPKGTFCNCGMLKNDVYSATNICVYCDKPKMTTINFKD